MTSTSRKNSKDNNVNADKPVKNKKKTPPKQQNNNNTEKNNDKKKRGGTNKNKTRNKSVNTTNTNNKRVMENKPRQKTKTQTNTNPTPDMGKDSLKLLDIVDTIVMGQAEKTSTSISGVKFKKEIKVKERKYTQKILEKLEKNEDWVRNIMGESEDGGSWAMIRISLAEGVTLKEGIEKARQILKKGVKICTNIVGEIGKKRSVCGTAVYPHHDTCYVCGNKLDWKYLTCPKCRKPIQVNQKQCPHCNTLLPIYVKCEKCNKIYEREHEKTYYPAGKTVCPYCGHINKTKNDVVVAIDNVKPLIFKFETFFINGDEILGAFVPLKYTRTFVILLVRNTYAENSYMATDRVSDYSADHMEKITELFKRCSVCGEKIELNKRISSPPSPEMTEVEISEKELDSVVRGGEEVRCKKCGAKIYFNGATYYPIGKIGLKGHEIREMKADETVLLRTLHKQVEYYTFPYHDYESGKWKLITIPVPKSSKNEVIQEIEKHPYTMHQQIRKLTEAGLIRSVWHPYEEIHYLINSYASKIDIALKNNKLRSFYLGTYDGLLYIYTRDKNGYPIITKIACSKHQECMKKYGGCDVSFCPIIKDLKKDGISRENFVALPMPQKYDNIEYENLKNKRFLIDYYIKLVKLAEMDIKREIGHGEVELTLDYLSRVWEYVREDYVVVKKVLTRGLDNAIKELGIPIGEHVDEENTTKQKQVSVKNGKYQEITPRQEPANGNGKTLIREEPVGTTQETQAQQENEDIEELLEEEIEY